MRFFLEMIILAKNIKSKNSGELCEDEPRITLPMAMILVYNFNLWKIKGIREYFMNKVDIKHKDRRKVMHTLLLFAVEFKKSTVEEKNFVDQGPEKNWSRQNLMIANSQQNENFQTFKFYMYYLRSLYAYFSGWWHFWLWGLWQPWDGELLTKHSIRKMKNVWMFNNSKNFDSFTIQCNRVELSSMQKSVIKSFQPAFSNDTFVKIKKVAFLNSFHSFLVFPIRCMLLLAMSIKIFEWHPNKKKLQNYKHMGKKVDNNLHIIIQKPTIFKVFPLFFHCQHLKCKMHCSNEKIL